MFTASCSGSKSFRVLIANEQKISLQRGSSSGIVVVRLSMAEQGAVVRAFRLTVGP